MKSRRRRCFATTTITRRRTTTTTTMFVPRAAFGGGGRKKKLKVDESVGGAVSGAVLGGMLLGPFGAILGGQFGANLGSDAKQARQAEEAMRRKGITPEVRQCERARHFLKKISFFLCLLFYSLLSIQQIRSDNSISTRPTIPTLRAPSLLHHPPPPRHTHHTHHTRARARMNIR